MSDTEKVIDYLLKNGGKLTAEKIQAFSRVIEALSDKNPVVREPNSIPVAEDQEELVNAPIDDLSEIENIQIDDNPKVKTKIYKA